MSIVSAASPGADDPPVVGQPLDFSGAVGTGFQVTMRVASTEVNPGEFFTVTIHIAARNGWKRLPQRPDLGALKPFKDRFDVERARSTAPDRQLGADSWEFDYRLRPKREGTVGIPFLRFVYYNPTILWPEKRWQVTYAHAIPLKVVPRLASAPRPIQAAPHMLQIAEGPRVVRNEHALLSRPLVFALLLLGPPVICLVWYLTWMRRYPDAARLARQRRSRAAQEALDRLSSVRTGEVPAQAARVAAILTQYLHHRLDLPAAEPTPAEVAESLQRSGFQPPVAVRVADLFRTCDTARFAAVFPTDAAELPQTAARLILEMEAEPWPS